MLFLSPSLSLSLIFSLSKKNRHRIQRERVVIATKKWTELRFIQQRIKKHILNRQEGNTTYMPMAARSRIIDWELRYLKSLLPPFLWYVIILKYRVFQKMSLHKKIFFMLYFRVSLFLNNFRDNKEIIKKMPSIDLNFYVKSYLSHLLVTPCSIL